MPSHRPRPPMGSLDSMASRIRSQKAASNTKTSHPTEVQSSSKGKKFTEDSSSNSGSDDDSDETGDDSDLDIEAARKKLKAKQASKHKAPEQNPESTKPDPTNAAANARTSSSPKPSSKAATTSPDESDSDSDSASQGSESNAGPAQNAASEKGGKSGKEADSDSDSDSSSESDSEAEEASAQQPAEAESSSSEASDGSSDTSDESSHENADAMDVDSDVVVVSGVNGNADAEGSTSQVARPAWLNSSNFVLRKASSDNPAKEVTEFFSNANLEGKQVWYFTAPASLPITVLKDMEIDLSKAATSEALLSYKGDDYGLDLESHATSTQIQLLIPSQGGDSYSALNRGIDSTVHLRRMAKFGPGGAVSATATESYAPVPKAVREQPQGLRPRYTPIGVPNPAQPQPPSVKPQPAPAAQTVSPSDSESQSEGDPDQDMATVSKSHMPVSSGSSKKSKKSDAVNGNRKRKHSGDDEDMSTLVQKSQSQEKSAKKPKTAKTSKASSFKKGGQTLTASASNDGAVSKAPTPSIKEKTKKKLNYSVPTKQTPIPLPTVLSMKR
ncbi:hypothetical protein F4677DRAFT_31615 [Hypoxylon crocopeplum]|nr:hypothetical protein F4677DRAFT_31615 [Hypoxylon crocopeplum]